MTKKKNKLVIIDAHAFIHRAYHALPSFTSSSGEPMGAVYGTASILLKLIRDLGPTHIAAAFDRAEPTFRHKAYKEYKATREKTKDDLIPQFAKVKEIFKAFNIPMFEVAGFEADDIIGTIVEKLKKEKDIELIIASGDMDTMQLVSGKRVRVYTLRKGIDDTILYDEDKVVERYSFKPNFVIDFKGLKGDPSDNIIGVRGIGDKTATSLINNYGTVEDIYKKIKKEKKHPKWLTERIKNLLLENEEEALFSKELATIRLDAPVELKLKDIEFKGIPYESAVATFREFHFPSLINRLEAPQGFEELKPATNIKKGEIKELEKVIKKTETIVLYKEEEKVVVGVKDKLFSFESFEGLEELLSLHGRIITDDAKSLFHTLGFLFSVEFDLRVAEWVIDSEKRAFDLGLLLEDRAKTTKNILELVDDLKKKLIKHKLEKTYYEFELPLIPVLYKMERDGVLVDEKHLGVLEKEVSKEIKKLEKIILDHAGEKFDINSPKQLSHILFEVLGLPTKGIKKTSTKSISTKFSELLKLQDLHPIIEPLIEYREVSKLYSTYIKALPELIANDGRVHTTFNQIGAATGRFSSTNPNLQNIPNRSERGREVRSVFIARPGYELVALDYSQIELRIAAALSKDKKMLETFKNNEDIHQRTASEVFHVALDKVTPDIRFKAKSINFGILYGMGARALAASIKVSAGEAQEYLDLYFEKFPAIRDFREKIIEDGRERGYVETIFGRKRFLPNLKASFDFVRKEAERMAVNAPFQGTNADIIKRAMIRIDNEVDKSDNFYMLLQVHDELVFEMKKDKIKIIIPKIKKIMEDVPELDIPIVVDVKIGHNWGDMKEWK
ncbi:MAG: DNA polymerase [bacterium]|nr:DNA polymerase [bacterium]